MVKKHSFPIRKNYFSSTKKDNSGEDKIDKKRGIELRDCSEIEQINLPLNYMEELSLAGINKTDFDAFHIKGIRGLSFKSGKLRNRVDEIPQAVVAIVPRNRVGDTDKYASKFNKTMRLENGNLFNTYLYESLSNPSFVIVEVDNNQKRLLYSTDSLGITMSRTDDKETLDKRSEFDLIHQISTIKNRITEKIDCPDDINELAELNGKKCKAIKFRHDGISESVRKVVSNGYTPYISNFNGKHITEQVKVDKENGAIIAYKIDSDSDPLLFHPDIEEDNIPCPQSILDELKEGEVCLTTRLRPPISSPIYYPVLNETVPVDVRILSAIHTTKEYEPYVINKEAELPSQKFSMLDPEFGEVLGIRIEKNGRKRSLSKVFKKIKSKVKKSKVKGKSDKLIDQNKDELKGNVSDEYLSDDNELFKDIDLSKKKVIESGEEYDNLFGDGDEF